MRVLKSQLFPVSARLQRVKEEFQAKRPRTWICHSVGSDAELVWFCEPTIP